MRQKLKFNLGILPFKEAKPIIMLRHEFKVLSENTAYFGPAEFNVFPGPIFASVIQSRPQLLSH